MHHEVARAVVMIPRRDLLRMLSGSVVSIPFLTRLSSWYGTLGQWLLHSKEGVLRLEAARRLVEIPGGALASLGGPGPNTFVKYIEHARVEDMYKVAQRGRQWIGHWQTTHGRILGWVDATGRAWWAKP
jgi:hypothetical protein